MGVFRVKKDSNYTVINNTCLRDEKISWKAKGLHAYMVSMPDDWVFYNEELVKRATDGKDSLKAAIKELSEAGYLKRQKVKDEKGKFSGWETVIYEIPQPKADIPTVGKPESRETPKSENPQLLSTDLNEVLNPLSTDSTKRDIVADAPSPPYGEIIDYLNEKTGKSFKAASNATRQSINARMKEGFTVDDFRRVIDIKTAEWIDDDKMCKFLRPATLFGTKFESYLNQQAVIANERNREAADITERYNFGF